MGDYPRSWETDDDTKAARAAIAARLQIEREALIQSECERMAISYEARQRHLRDLDPFSDETPAGVLTAAELRDRLPPTQPDRVEGILKADSGAVLAARRGAGKTTFAVNLARCLLTGEPFLGTQRVSQLDTEQRVAFMSYDMATPALLEWANDSGVPLERMLVVDLNGKRNPLADPDEAARLADQLRGAGTAVLVVDAFSQAFVGESQNDAGEVARFMSRLAQFTRRATGSGEFLLIAHAAKSGGDARGSGAIEEPVGSSLLLDSEEGKRTLRTTKYRATGTNKPIPETGVELAFDEDTKTISVVQPGSGAAPDDGDTGDGQITVDNSDDANRQARDSANRMRAERDAEDCEAIRGVLLDHAGEEMSRGAILTALQQQDAPRWSGASASRKLTRRLGDLTVSGEVNYDGATTAKRWWIEADSTRSTSASD